MRMDSVSEVHTAGWPSSHDAREVSWSTQRILGRVSFPRVAYVVQKGCDASSEEPPMIFPCSRRLAALAFVVIFVLSFAVAQGLAAG